MARYWKLPAIGHVPDDDLKDKQVVRCCNDHWMAIVGGDNWRARLRKASHVENLRMVASLRPQGCRGEENNPNKVADSFHIPSMRSALTATWKPPTLASPESSALKLLQVGLGDLGYVSLLLGWGVREVEGGEGVGDGWIEVGD